MSAGFPDDRRQHRWPHAGCLPLWQQRDRTAHPWSMFCPGQRLTVDSDFQSRSDTDLLSAAVSDRNRNCRLLIDTFPDSHTPHFPAAAITSPNGTLDHRMRVETNPPNPDSAVGADLNHHQGKPSPASGNRMTGCSLSNTARRSFLKKLPNVGGPSFGFSSS